MGEQEVSVGVMGALRLPFDFEPGRLLADLSAIRPDEWLPHFNTRIYDGEWSGVALRAPGGKHQLYPDPTATDFAATPILDRCPYFRDVMAVFRCPLTSVRLLRLAAGSSIGEHCDYRLGYEDGEVRIHVPIVTDDAVAFFVAGSRVPMRPGESWYLNVNLPHRVDNRSTIDRIHLVLDCVVDPWLAGVFGLPLPEPQHI